MDLNAVVNVVISVMSGLVVMIPLVIKLIEYVKKAVKEKNWSDLLNLVIEYMKSAEEKFKDGEEKKEWVLVMIKASADKINYDIDLDVVSKMIDDLCDMSNVVNPPAEGTGE